VEDKRRATPGPSSHKVEWLFNRTDKGWLVALFDPAGANKP
jgi:hypothetical protein